MNAQMTSEERKEVVRKIIEEIRVTDVHDKLIVFPFPSAGDYVMSQEDFQDIHRLLTEYADTDPEFKGAIGLCYLPSDFKTMTRQEIEETIANLQKMLDQ